MSGYSYAAEGKQRVLRMNAPIDLSTPSTSRTNTPVDVSYVSILPPPLLLYLG